MMNSVVMRPRTIRQSQFILTILAVFYLSVTTAVAVTRENKPQRNEYTIHDSGSIKHYQNKNREKELDDSLLVAYVRCNEDDNDAPSSSCQAVLSTNATDEPEVKYICSSIEQAYSTLLQKTDSKIIRKMIRLLPNSYCTDTDIGQEFFSDVGDRGSDIGTSIVGMGGNITLDCQNSSQRGILMSSGGIDHVSGFTIQNCGSDQKNEEIGGAIKIISQSHPMIVENMTFVQNQQFHGGAIGIIESETPILIKNCVFQQNFALNYGGAVYASSIHSSSKTEIYGCQFENNKANLGGAISINNKEEVFISSSIFKNNVAKWKGGAIHALQSCKITVERSKFHSNQISAKDIQDSDCGIAGGAIFAQNSFVSCFKTNFDKNRVVYSVTEKDAYYDDDTNIGVRGGAIGIKWTESFNETIFSCSHCMFESNEAKSSNGASGGAISVHINHHNLDDIISSRGADNNVLLNIQNSLFRWNEARRVEHSNPNDEDDSYDVPSNAMNNNKGGALSLQFATVKSSKATLQLEEIHLHSTKFHQNQAGIGGAVFIDGGGRHSLEMSNSTFTSNGALSSTQYRSAGGAIALHNLATLSIDRSTFVENFASPSTPTKIIKSSLTAQQRRQLSWFSPVKSGDGGAIHLQKVNSGVSISSTHFEKNIAGGGMTSTLGPRGGAIFQSYTFASNKNHCESFRFQNLTFVENGAMSITSKVGMKPGTSGRGGAISAHFSSLCIFSSLFERNFATFDGGENPAFGGAVDLYQSHGETLINSCKIHGNHIYAGNSGDVQIPERDTLLQGRGGAISVLSSSTIKIVKSSISQNSISEKKGSTPSLGGGLYLDGTSSGNYEKTNFSGNRARIGHDICSIRHTGHELVHKNIFRDCQFFEESQVIPAMSSSRDHVEFENFHIVLLGGTSIFHENVFSNSAYNILIAGPESSVTLTLIRGILMEEVGSIENSNLQFSHHQSNLANVGLFNYNSTIELDTAGEMSLNQLYVSKGAIKSKNLSSLIVQKQAYLFHAILDSDVSLKVDVKGVLKDVDFPSTEGSIISLRNVDFVVSGSYSTQNTKLMLYEKSSITVADNASIFLQDTMEIFVDNKEEDYVSFIIDGNVFHESCSGNIILSDGSISMSPSGIIHMKLCEPNNTIPLLEVKNGNSLIHGTFDLKFSNDTLVKDGISWLIGSFNQDNDDTIQWEISSPDGIRTELKKSSDIDGVLHVSILIPEEGVNCEKMLNFGATGMDNTDKCSLCLDTRGRCVWDHISFQCAPVSFLETSSESSHRYSSTNCCPESCNDHGHCSKNHDDSLFCECQLFFTGAACESISNTGYVIIILSCVALTFVVLASINSLSNRRAAIVAVQSTMNDIQVGLLDYFQMTEALEKEINAEQQNQIKENGSSLSFLSLGFIQGIRDMILLRDVCVKPDELEVKTDILLGEGAFGVVHLGSLRGSNVAVKMVQRHFLLDMDKEELNNLKKEALLMSRMRHPNIALLMGICLPDLESNLSQPENPASFSIVTEYMNLGSLTDVLKAVHIKRENISINPKLYSSRYNLAYLLEKVSEVDWNYKLILTSALQAAQGMTYLHSHTPPICHRDLKSSNLLVDDKWTIKVTDFGVSRTMAKNSNKYVHTESSRGNGTQHNNGCSPLMASSQTDIMTSNLGTTAWTAPEMFVPELMAEYGLKVDVYSFGIVLWEMFECTLPYSGMSRFDIKDAVRSGHRPSFRDRSSCPPFYNDLYQMCVSQNPEDRPTFPEIVDQLKLELETLRQSSIEMK